MNRKDGKYFLATALSRPLVAKVLGAKPFDNLDQVSKKDFDFISI